VKILRIIARLNVGGPTLQVVLLNSELEKRGHRCLLLTGEVEFGEGDMSYVADSLGVNLKQVPCLGRRISPKRDIVALKNILRIIRRERPDVVHTHTAKAGTLGRTAAVIADVRCIVHTFHGTVFEGYFSPIKSSTFRTIEKTLASVSDHVIAISPRLKHELTSVYRIVSEAKCSVIPLGFDLDAFYGLRQTQSTRARVGWIGRLTAIKDPLNLVDIASILPEVSFEVIGDGEMRPQVEQSVLTRDLRNVRLAGWQRDMPSCYGNLGLVLLTSNNEGTPVALIEAMASGLAFVAPAVGGIPDLMIGPSRVEDGFDIFSNGILTHDRKPETFANAVRWLLAQPGEARRMGEHGRAFVRSRYSKERLVKDVEDLYHSIFDSKRCPSSA
jgi:glycosyltransferase involved in cell wall biosynthesis